MPSEPIEPLNHSRTIPSSTPCEVCGEPATWLVALHPGDEHVLCDKHYVKSE